MHAHLLLLIQEYDISLRLPEIDFSRVEVEWGRLRSNIPEVWKLSNDGREFQAGDAMKERGLTAQFPVVVIPGIISTVRDPVPIDHINQPKWISSLWNLGQLHLNIALSSARKCGVVSVCYLR